MACARSSPSWVILGSALRVAADSDAAQLPPGAADFSLTLAAPPRVAVLTIPARIFRGPCSPSVIAVDPSGLLLLHADQGPDASALFVLDARSATALPKAPGGFVLDTTATTALDAEAVKFLVIDAVKALPNFPGGFALDAKAAAALTKAPRSSAHDAKFSTALPVLLGIVASPAEAGHYMVAELHISARGDTAEILCYCSQAGEWTVKRMACPPPPPPPSRFRQLSANGVLAHAGKLWWIDLSSSLLACDPFADAPVLHVVPLPERREAMPRDADDQDLREVCKYRFVAASGGKLRFVDMYRTIGACGFRQIRVWTLADADTTEWTLQHEVAIGKIWSDEGVRHLPWKMPVPVLIHPANPDVLYFLDAEDMMRGVNLRAGKVLECAPYKQVAPPSRRVVHGWQLPSALCRSGAATPRSGSTASSAPPTSSSSHNNASATGEAGPSSGGAGAEDLAPLEQEAPAGAGAEALAPVGLALAAPAALNQPEPEAERNRWGNNLLSHEKGKARESLQAAYPWLRPSIGDDRLLGQLAGLIRDRLGTNQNFEGLDGRARLQLVVPGVGHITTFANLFKRGNQFLASIQANGGA